MAKKDEDAKRRKAQKKLKADRNQHERSVKFEQNGKTMLLRQSGGYDVKMIRDFFDHLMLELKNRHDESTVMLESLEAGDPWKYAYAKSQAIETPVDDELYRKYLEKYRCALLATNAIDTKGATDEEITMFLKAQRSAMAESSFRMMECLKALEEQLDESLICARMPFSPMEGGMITPTNQIRVLDHIEKIRKAIDEEEHNIVNPSEDLEFGGEEDEDAA